MNVRRSLHTRFVFTLDLLLVWGGLLGAVGVAHGQASYEILSWPSRQEEFIPLLSDSGQRGHALWHHAEWGSIWSRYGVPVGCQR